MGRRKKSEIGKVKIKLVGSKIKAVSVLDEEGNKLEKELKEESDKGFSEFVQTGNVGAPVLETGQETTSAPRTQVVERQPGEQAVSQEARPATGLVNPEFSVYEIARGFARGGGGGGGGRVRYQVSQHGDDIAMQKRMPAPRQDEMQSSLVNRRRDFSNPELESLRAGDDRGGKYYEATVKGDEVKRDRKMPWE